MGWLRLRQVALIAPELEAPVAALKDVFGLAEGFRDDHLEAMFGLTNCLLPIGEQLLEVCATVKPDTQGTRFLQRRGAGGYMVILQAEPHAAFRDRIGALGVRVIAEAETPAYHLVQLHPRDTGGPMLEVDRHEGGDTPQNPWTHAAGTNWRQGIRTGRISAIAAAEIQSDDPAATAARWSVLLDRPVHTPHDGTHGIALDGSDLRFVKASDGRGEGLGGIDLRATDRAGVLAAAKARDLPVTGDTIELAGIRFRLV